ncbi:MAG: LamG domain-containing protein [Crocinitomicaceae bacterium]|jgi:hypothetical protein|nr:LamG domain-containing protein [Crocinitomicaceae bacterium]
MKKTLQIFILLTLSLNAYSQVPNYVPTNGLVGWWPFNGNANDESGNNNNGTVNNVNSAIDRFGNVNSAFSFNRQFINEINVNNSSSLNSLYNITISIWVKLVSYNEPGQAGYNHWINKSDQSNNHHFVFANNASQVYFYYTGAAGFFATNNLPQLNQWTHIVVTHNYDGSQNSICKFYFDGNLIESIPAIQPINQTLDNLKIGAFGAYNYNRVDGSLDDIGIWNRALTACEIQNLYQSQVNNVSQAISAGADQSICAGDNVSLNGSGGANYQWNNNVVDGAPFAPTQSNAYVVNGTDSLGCTGSDTVVVSVLENAASSLTQTALDSYTLNGQTYTQSGTYTQVIAAANGCDSTITLNLTLNFTGIHELGTATKILVKITDLNGKIIQRRKNTVMLFIYEDGTVERVVEME